jgi:hypothetical protein
MSVSQIDMVALIGSGGLQVCGDLGPTEGEKAAPPSTDLQSVTAVVRQGNKVATLHAAAPFDREAFELHENGRWELKGKLGQESLLKARRSAVVSAVIILKREPAGLETLSWVQPVKIVSDWRLTGRPHELRPQVIVQPEKSALAIGHTVSSSLTILHHDNAAGGDTFSGLQRIDKVPPAGHATP